VIRRKSPFLGAFSFLNGKRSAVDFRGVHLASKEQQIEQLLQPTVEALGFDLWGIEYVSQGRHSVVRIFIDAEQGITVDDCAAVSHQAGSVLDVEEPITGEYTLEVSSPGMDRLLFKLEQYPQYANEVIELRLRSPFEGRRKFKGILKGIEGEDIVVQVDDHEYLLPHSAVDKARIEPRI
jgi:ribosome maturation factor RimP